MALSIVLEMTADAWPERVALGPRSGGLSYGGLWAAAGRGAAAVRESGARTVGYLGSNGPDFAVAFWSAVRAGLPFCPLNYRLAAGQAGQLIDTLESPVVLVADEYRILAAAGAAPAIGLGAFVAAACDDSRPRVTDLAEVADEQTAVLLFTSGTTSAPKGVLLTHANLTSYVLDTVEFGSAGPDDAVLVTMPPYHVGGVNASVTNPFAGRRIVYLPDFDAAQWLRLVREESITHAMVVPTMLARILDVLDGAPVGAPALRVLSYGGARMPRAVLERAVAAFPDTDFVNAYGLTETSSTIAVLGPEDHRVALRSDDPVVRDRLGSVGRPVPGVSVQVRDERGSTLGPGKIGELWLRGRQISGRYLGDRSVLDADGWFPTRDQGRLDADGYLYVDGRADDTIIRGGENIAPAEIEDVLVAHDGILDAAVVGRPDDEWGERIVAAVVRRAGADLAAADVREFVRTRLRGSRTPDEVVFVEALPYTPTGKLIRRDLVARLSATVAGD
jgi:acyl-CoA synthetase (AMP-forming)/AMP-acid ligase II